MTPAELLDDLFARRNQVPELQDLTHSIISKFGGADKFAEEIFAQYTAAGKTPMARVKILDSIIRLINQTNDKRHASPADTATRQEMENALTEAMQRIHNAETKEKAATT
jgi:hypothetical protein